MISITLEGYLGKKLGKSWILNVGSIVEIFEAIEANTNKITRFHKNLEKFVTHFVVYINGKLMPAHLVNSKILNSGDVLRIVPVIQGGLFWLIIGLVLIVLSMVLAVVLSPKAPKDVKTSSAILGGIRNVLNRNIPVPIGYGRMRIGSAVVSNNIVLTSASIRKGGGGGYEGSNRLQDGSVLTGNYLPKDAFILVIDRDLPQAQIDFLTRWVNYNLAYYNVT